MNVSGDLFRLPDDRRLIPLPWFCRAPLGLRSGTSVHVALVESNAAAPPTPADPGAASFDANWCRPPDVLVSVIDPQAWDETVLVSATAPDGPGRLHGLLKAIADANDGNKYINVTMGESFTVPDPASNGRDRSLRVHRTELYCRLQPTEEARAVFDKMVDDAGDGVTSRDFPRPAGYVARYLGQTEVHRGLIVLDNDWRRQARDLFVSGLAAKFPQSVDAEARASAVAEQYDFDVVLALADLDARGIRFTFPFKNARRLTTRHADEPNTAIKVTNRLHATQSILAGLLAKSDAGSATMVAVCEPLPKHAPLVERPFLELQTGTDFRTLQARGPLDYRDVIHEQLPADELFRQLGKRLSGHGKHAMNLVRQLADIEKAGHAPSRRTSAFAVSANALNHRHRRAIDLLRDLCASMKFDDRGDLNVNLLYPPLRRLFRLMTADLAVFIKWRSTPAQSPDPQTDPVLHAMLFSYLSKGSGLLLVESDQEQVADYLMLRSCLRQEIAVRPFVWTDEHITAFDAYSANPAGPRPPLLKDPSFLLNQIGNWIAASTLESFPVTGGR